MDSAGLFGCELPFVLHVCVFLFGGCACQDDSTGNQIEIHFGASINTRIPTGLTFREELIRASRRCFQGMSKCFFVEGTTPQATLKGNPKEQHILGAPCV